MIRVSPNPIQRNKARGILTWYARVFDTETKNVHYESLGTTKKTQAKDILQEKIRLGEFKIEKTSDITLENAFALFIEHEKKKGVKQKSITIFENALKCLSPIYGTKVCDLEKSMVVDTFSSSCDSLAPATYNLKKVICKSAFKFFVKNLDLLGTNLMDFVPSRKKVKKERHFWTVEQVDLLLDAAQDPMDRLIWSFMAFSGLRIHEALKIVPSDIHDGYIHVIGKGDRFALIPLSSRMNEELCRVGWEWDFKGRTTGKENYRIKKAEKEVGLGSKGTVSNHRFRHSFASNLVRSDVNLKVVQTLMRHSDIQTTLNIYSHLIDSELGNEMEKMFK